MGSTCACWRVSEASKAFVQNPQAPTMTSWTSSKSRWVVAGVGHDAGPFRRRSVEDQPHVISAGPELLCGDQWVEHSSQVAVGFGIGEDEDRHLAHQVLERSSRWSERDRQQVPGHTAERRASRRCWRAGRPNENRYRSRRHRSVVRVHDIIACHRQWGLGRDAGAGSVRRSPTWTTWPSLYADLRQMRCVAGSSFACAAQK